LEGGFAASGSDALKDRISGANATDLDEGRGGGESPRALSANLTGLRAGEGWPGAWFYAAGQSHAAPRTPEESPCAAGLTGVVKLSENTWGSMAGPMAG
jgi:hypothetical protein